MIYIIEASSPFSKIEIIEIKFIEAKKVMDIYNNMGYIVSVTPKDMSFDEYRLSVDNELRKFFEDNYEEIQ